MKNNCINRLDFAFSAISENESVARSLVAVAVSTLDPTLEELADLRCAVSEAVTNAIVHGYKNGAVGEGKREGRVYISVRLYKDRSVKIEVRDKGVGIADIARAREPLYTTDESGERRGMGFAVMEAFTDRVRVYSRVGHGTRVTLLKRLSVQEKTEGADT